MAEYRALLERAIEALPENNGASRRQIYEKARSALAFQLREIDPPLPARDITQHRLKLEDCIRIVEQFATDQLLDGFRKLAGPNPDTNDPISDILDEQLGAEGDRIGELSSDDLIANLAALMARDATGEGDEEQSEEFRGANPTSEAVKEALGQGTQEDSSLPNAPFSRQGAPLSAAPPTQVGNVTTFAARSDGKIGVSPSANGVRLLETPDQILGYDALRSGCVRLLDESYNLLGSAAIDLEALRAAMPVDIRDAQVFPLWRAGNRIRRIYSAHSKIESGGEGHPFALDAAIAEHIGALCDEFNNLAMTDPGLRSRDTWRITPGQSDSIAEEVAVSDTILAEASDAEILADEARDYLSLDSNLQASIDDDSLSAKEVGQIGAARRNFIALLMKLAFEAAKKLIRLGQDELKLASRKMREGLYSSLGKSVGGIAGAFALYAIVRHAPDLMKFASSAFKSPESVELINWLVKSFTP